MRRPSTPWVDSDGNAAGVVHQERNWTYVLVEGAGHVIPYNNPSRVGSFLSFRRIVLLVS